MTKVQFEAAIRDRFEPIPVISKSPKVQRLIEQAIAFFSKNYTMRLMRTIAITDNPITLPMDVGTVTGVYDVQQPNTIMENKDVLNYFFRTYYSRLSYSFEEMLALKTFWANTKQIFNDDNLVWKFVREAKPPHLLFTENFRNSHLTIEFKLEFNPADPAYDYTGYAEDWIWRYALVLVQIAEGEIIRKSESIDIPSDGQSLVTEAKEEKTHLEEELRGKNRLFVLKQ